MTTEPVLQRRSITVKNKKMKKILCLSEIQIYLGSLYFIWQCYAKTMPSISYGLSKDLLD